MRLEGSKASQVGAYRPLVGYWNEKVLARFVYVIHVASMAGNSMPDGVDVAGGVVAGGVVGGALGEGGVVAGVGVGGVSEGGVG